MPTRAERYQAAKTANPPRCTYGACREPPCEDSLLCERHRDKYNARHAKLTRMQRARLVEAGKCVTCRRPSTTFRCPACRIAASGNLPTKGVTTGVTITGDQWREDPDGWRRFRGRGKKGRVGAQADDATDIAEAIKCIERGKEALAYAFSPAVAETGALSRRAALNAATAPLRLAVRFLEDVCDRHRK